MLNFTSRTNFYICSIPTDMRKGREGLATIVREYFHRDPISTMEKPSSSITRNMIR
ncbi:MAG: IS66 family insertion sequence element accessory protein TnpB [Segatella copri]